MKYAVRRVRIVISMFSCLLMLLDDETQRSRLGVCACTSTLYISKLRLGILKPIYATFITPDDKCYRKQTAVLLVVFRTSPQAG